MKNKLCVLLAALSVPLTFCNGQERKSNVINFQSEYKFNSEIETELQADTTSWKHQVSASKYAAKGDYQNALKQWDLGMGSIRESSLQDSIHLIKKRYKKTNAIDYIVEQSKSNRIIIINEAHHNSFHRVFTKSLLQKLFDNGYKNLGLEALSYKDNPDSLQKIRKYPVYRTGYYIKDPQFGNLIREALEIGFTLFPYETTQKEYDGETREIDQARNIAKFIEENPDGKLLIHCGFDHALEGPHTYWEKAMAERLKEYTGIDPLTINQVAYSEKSKPELNSPVLEAFDIKESAVLLDHTDRPLKYRQEEAHTDIAVFHPTTRYVNNRPEWLFRDGHKKVYISLKDIDLSFPVMVLAFKSGENIENAIPVDIVEINNNTEACNLALKKGNYNIVITNGKQSITFEQQVR